MPLEVKVCAIEISQSVCGQIADTLATLDASCARAVGGESTRVAAPSIGAGGFYAKLTPLPPVSLTINELESVIRFLRKCLGCTTPQDDGHPTGARPRIRTWQLCQLLTEKYVSEHYLATYGWARPQRRWDYLYPSQVGDVHLTSRLGACTGRPRMVVGQPCPECSVGRVRPFAEPQGCEFGLTCNAGCGFGCEASYCSIARTDSETAIWHEPKLPRGAEMFLPGQHLDRLGSYRTVVTPGQRRRPALLIQAF